MKFNYVQKEPDKAYVSNRLWLPKSQIRVGPIRKALEFTVNGQRGQTAQIRMWEESSSHIICPREFLPPSQYSSFKFPFIDLRPDFPSVTFEDLVKPRNEEQEKAWAALAANDNGILNLGCGKGKTKLALKKIAQRKMPTLVIVPDGGILEQWKESIYGNKEKGLAPGLAFEGKLGICQAQTMDWKHPVTLALVTTLGLRIRDDGLAEEMFRYFGTIIYDEVHQIGAPMFSLTAGPFYGDRIGLTATVTREDGLDPIYRYHIGEPFYSDLTQDLVPRIYFQQTPARLNYEEAKINRITNISLLRSMLGKDYASNVYRYWSICDALKENRKILVLSHSKAQLRLFHALFPGSGLIISETEKSERMDVLRNSQLCFAIARLGSTGVDDDRLDTLFWLTPFRSKISLQQSMGRIQRHKEGKKSPVMVVFEDWLTPSLRRMCMDLRHSLRTWALPFETCKPTELPRDLPSEAKARYEETFSTFRGEDEEEEDDSVERKSAGAG